MTREELNRRITGTETPHFISEREHVILTKCLEIINNPNFPETRKLIVMDNEIDFDNWYDLFAEYLRKAKKYSGPIDRDSARNDYDNGLSPEEAAESLYTELNS